MDDRVTSIDESTVEVTRGGERVRRPAEWHYFQVRHSLFAYNTPPQLRPELLPGEIWVATLTGGYIVQGPLGG